jgi:hypothetical protein
LHPIKYHPDSSLAPSKGIKEEERGREERKEGEKKGKRERRKERGRRHQKIL